MSQTGRIILTMSSHATDLFLHSLKRCLTVPAFLEDFYDRFVGSSEEVREKFRGVDLKRQVRMLEDSLYVVAVAAQGEEGSPARGALPFLAARHSRHDLDIRPELLRLVDRLHRRDGARARSGVQPGHRGGVARDPHHRRQLHARAVLKDSATGAAAVGSRG